MGFSHLTPWAASITGQPSLNWNQTVGNKQGQLTRTDHQHMDKKVQRAVTGPPDASNPHPVSQEWLKQSCPYHWYRIISELKGSAQDWGGGVYTCQQSRACRKQYMIGLPPLLLLGEKMQTVTNGPCQPSVLPWGTEGWGRQTVHQNGNGRKNRRWKQVWTCPPLQPCVSSNIHTRRKSASRQLLFLWLSGWWIINGHIHSLEMLHRNLYSPCLSSNRRAGQVTETTTWRRNNILDYVGTTMQFSLVTPNPAHQSQIARQGGHLTLGIRWQT